MRPLSARRVERILLVNGFILARQRGSHRIYKHPLSGAMVPVPSHGGARVIPIGTFLSIVRASGLAETEFRA